MALPANWYFGGRSPQEGDQMSPFGEFNLSGINDSPPVVSSVASPSPSAGVSGSGGMGVGQANPAGTPAAQQPDASTPSTSTPDSNANVTGFNGDLASTGLTAATFGLPGIGSVVGPAIGAAAGPLAGLIASMVANQAVGSAAPSSLVDSFGNPVTYTGNGPFGLPTGSLHRLNMGEVDPNPVDPNMPSPGCRRRATIPSATVPTYPSSD